MIGEPPSREAPILRLAHGIRVHSQLARTQGSGSRVAAAFSRPGSAPRLAMLQASVWLAGVPPTVPDEPDWLATDQATPEPGGSDC